MVQAVMTTRSVIMCVLVLWTLAGPVGMALSCCAIMCEGPCGVCTPAQSTADTASVVPPTFTPVVPVSAELLASALRVLEPPPKPLLAA